MANLTSGSIDSLHQQAMEWWSSRHEPTPISKSDLRALLVLMDEEIETAESSIVSALPSGTGKTWLLGKPEIGRFLMERIMRERKETL
ncbi:MAG: hypothetical protein B7733_06340 [Myxococcales bacterium FL481]|nr:MAG: hypothetical protein B7733_06340 [Myxococcales bacterium FL481]